MRTKGNGYEGKQKGALPLLAEQLIRAQQRKRQKEIIVLRERKVEVKKAQLASSRQTKNASNIEPKNPTRYSA